MICCWFSCLTFSLERICSLDKILMKALLMKIVWSEMWQNISYVSQKGFDWRICICLWRKSFEKDRRTEVKDWTKSFSWIQRFLCNTFKGLRTFFGNILGFTDGSIFNRVSISWMPNIKCETHKPPPALLQAETEKNLA